MTAFRSHLDNSGQPPHLKIINLIPSAESVLLYQVVLMGVGDEDVAIFGHPCTRTHDTPALASWGSPEALGLHQAFPPLRSWLLLFPLLKDWPTPFHLPISILEFQGLAQMALLFCSFP